MKKIILGFTLMTSLIGHASTSYVCEDAYQAKLEKIEKNRFLRETTKAGIVLGFVVGGVLIPTLWIGPVGIISGIVSTGPLLGATGSAVGALIDREPGLLTAVEFFKLIQRPREEVKQEAYKEYILKTQARLNYVRDQSYTYEEVQARHPIESLKLETLVDQALEAFNKVRINRGQSELNYEAFQSLITSLLDTDSFCPENKKGKRKPQTIRAVVQTLTKSDF
jgi:hypothetical protein